MNREAVAPFTARRDHQCADRAQGRQTGRYDGGLPRRPRDRPRGPLRHVRSLHRSAGAPGAAHLRLEVRSGCSPTAASSPRSMPRASRPSPRLLAPGVEAIAISLLHAYRNPAHELAPPASRPMAPGLPCRARRGRAGDSRVRADVDDGRQRLRDAAHGPLPRGPRAQDRELGVPGPFYIMLSSGGIATPETAQRAPIRLVESGPAAGASAAARLARRAGESRMLSFDMGGTTAKACVIDEGEPLVARRVRGGARRPIQEGLGLTIRVPVIEMIEIGAGGGSIARIDSLGLLKVGPDSAGADPGPACYARGGREPTVTDADLVLGYLDPEFFWAARMRLDVEASRQAIDDRVAKPLGLGLIAAAGHPPGRQREHGGGRAHPRHRARQGSASVSASRFGGAGPVHAWAVGRILRVPRVLVPFGAGAFPRMASSPPPRVRFRTHRASAPRRGGLARRQRALGNGNRRPDRPAGSGLADGDITVHRSAEMRYVGQGHEVEVDVPPGALGPTSLDSLTAAFEAATGRCTAALPLGVAIEALNWRAVLSGPAPDLSMRPRRRPPRVRAEATRSRSAGPLSPRRRLRRHAGL